MVSLFITILLNLALIPTEATSSSGTNPALLLRAIAWAALILISILYTKGRISRSIGITFALLALAFTASNFEIVSLSNTWTYYLILNSAGAACIISAVSTSRIFRDHFIAAINLTLLAWISAFCFQAIVYYTTNNVIDLHAAIFPFSEQRSELISSDFTRIGGIHIEPGTYANWMYGLIFIKTIIDQTKTSPLILAGILTLPLTGSFWGAIAFIFAATSLLTNREWANYLSKKSILIIGIVAAATPIAITYIQSIYLYLLSRSTLEDNSSQAKVIAYETYYNKISDYIFTGTKHYESFCEWCYSPQDAGILLNLSTKIGIVPAVILLFATLYTLKKRSFSVVLLFIPALFAKWYYWDHIFWITILSIFTPTHTNHKTQDYATVKKSDISKQRDQP